MGNQITTCFRSLFLLPLALLAIAAFPANAAGTLTPPAGKTILSVSGDIALRNQADRADFDKDMLQSLGWQKVDSHTRWTEGSQSFEGVPLQTLLQKLGAKGSKVVAVALNDYKVEIPLSDVNGASPLLALKHNGEWMSVREKGPIWIIYPYSKVEDITDIHASRMVWQLRSLRIE